MILERKKDGRHKGRLVGQGFLEPRWMTKGREDSPVANHSTIRAVFFGAGDESGQDDDLVGSIDVSTAFLQADLYKEGECKRYATFREYRGGPLRVFRLLGPLYGSRDSPRRWFDTLKAELMTQAYGFIPCPTDPCAFHNPETGVRLALVVDDLLV